MTPKRFLPLLLLVGLHAIAGCGGEPGPPAGDEAEATAASPDAPPTTDDADGEGVPGEGADVGAAGEGTAGTATAGETARNEPRAPDFYLPVLAAGGAPPDDPAARKDGVKLSDYRGRVVVLNFWATWCPPCLEELPMIDSLATEYGGEEVAFLGVLENDRASKARDFLEERGGLSYPVVRSVDLSLKRGYGLRGLPYTFVIRPDGRIAYAHRGGPIAREVLEARLRRVMEEEGIELPGGR